MSIYKVIVIPTNGDISPTAINEMCRYVAIDNLVTRYTVLKKSVRLYLEVPVIEDTYTKYVDTLTSIYKSSVAKKSKANKRLSERVATIIKENNMYS